MIKFSSEIRQWNEPRVTFLFSTEAEAAQVVMFCALITPGWHTISLQVNAEASDMQHKTKVLFSIFR